MIAAMRAPRLAACLLLSTSLAGCGLWPATPVPRASGIVEFNVATTRGPLRVHAYVPESGVDQAAVWVVMHGQNRDAGAYFQSWLAHARALRAILVVPEFDKAHWPTSVEYPLGNVMTKSGARLPREEWGFTAMERAVAEALRRAARDPERTPLTLYGHGAGAQFVQRYVMQMDTRRVRLAVAAAAGWYLLPEKTFDFPYGLSDLPIEDAQLQAALAAPLVILVGQSDTRSDGVIRRNARADAQGLNRVDRGRYLLSRAQAAAKALGVTLKWRLQEAPGVGHREADMTPVALALLKE